LFPTHKNDIVSVRYHRYKNSMPEATIFCSYACAVFWAAATSAVFLILGILMLVPSVHFGNKAGGIVLVVLGGTGVAGLGGGAIGGLFGAALGSPIDCCCCDAV